MLDDYNYAPMEFNGYNFKAEWYINNFQASQPEYSSPFYSSQYLGVRLTAHNNSPNHNGVLCIAIKATMVTLGITMSTSLIINNKNDKKSIRINNNESISSNNMDILIPCQILSKDITTESGYLQNGSLQIVIFFTPQFAVQNTAPTSSKVVKYSTDWIISENIEDYHSTLDPLELKIGENTLNLSIILIKNDYGTYEMQIDLSEPDFSFKGELEVKLNNYINSSRSITKREDVNFDPENFDLNGFTIDLREEDFSNSKNGWIIYDTATGEVTKGVHFTITFKQAREKALDEKEAAFEKLVSYKVTNVKCLKPQRPLTLPQDEYGFFIADLIYGEAEILSGQPLSSDLLHAGEIVFQATVDLDKGLFIAEIKDSLVGSGHLFFLLTFVNANDSLTETQQFQVIFSETEKVLQIGLPFRRETLHEGWLVGGKLRVGIQIVGNDLDRQWTRSSNYPIIVNSSSQGSVDGWRFFVPVSRFTSSDEKKTVALNPIFFNGLNVKVSLATEKCKDEGKLVLMPRISTTSDAQAKLSLLVSFENKDEAKSITYKYYNIASKSIKISKFTISLKDSDGFVFHSSESDKNIVVCVKLLSNSMYETCIRNAFGIELDDLVAVDTDGKVVSLSSMFDGFFKMIAGGGEEPITRTKVIIKEVPPPISSPLQNEKKVPAVKSVTKVGYVGLRNQGATCYLNSLIQALFHLPALRRLVYMMPTKPCESSIPASLQRLFYQLQVSDSPCSTNDLTRSFGWGSSEVFVQNDVEEFLRVLIDSLETRLAETDMKDGIARLLRGRYRQRIKCKNVEFEKSVDETFYDLQMNVRGTKNLYDSFERYIHPEELVGDNQYTTPDFGKQDAVMETEFIEFPPVLHIHLKRFLFNKMMGKMIKINDRFEFPETIDLTNFLSDDSPQRGKSNAYDLYGVLVHIGLDQGGHYYSVLRTSTSNQWYMFNDANVMSVSKESAVEGNYGGGASPYEVDADQAEAARTTGIVGDDSSRSGYILIYVRHDESARIFEPVGDDKIPEHLKHEAEMLPVRCVTESILATNSACRIQGFFPPRSQWDRVCSRHPEDAFTLLVRKDAKTDELFRQAAQKMNCQPSQLRLWNCTTRGLPEDALPCNDQLDVGAIIGDAGDISLLLQTLDGEQQDIGADLHVFVKFFFSEPLLRLQSTSGDEQAAALSEQLSAPLQYLFSARVRPTDSIEEIAKRARLVVGLPDGFALEALLAESGGIFRKLSLGASFGASYVRQCSTVVLQAKKEAVEGAEPGSLAISFKFVVGKPNMFKYDGSKATQEALLCVENFAKSEYGRPKAAAAKK